MASDKALARRRYSEVKKTQVLAECSEPGASVAKVAMAHGINANVVHRWRQIAREGAAVGPVEQTEFVALPLAVPAALPPAPAADIRIELHRGTIALSISWPASESSACADWLRELLR